MTTTTTQPATAVELEAAARKRLTALRNALGRADHLLVEAYAARDWLALGHATWKAYVAAELPELQLLQVRGEARDERIVELARAGLTMGPIADALAVGKGTVHRALDGVDLGETATAADGRTMARRQAPAQRKRRGPRKTDKAVELAATVETFTVLDVVASTRWSQNKASATLTRLVQSGRLEYLAPERRGQFGRYRRVVAG